MSTEKFELLNERITACHRCPRLVAFRETVPIKLRVEGEHPWRKPVPGFGDEKGWLLILGLAPSIQGANRTGRPFTGDETGRFLFKMLYLAGFATQPEGVSKKDGLRLKGCFLTASVKCVPPMHKPLREEFINCNPYLLEELALLKNLRAVLALGKHAFDIYQAFLKQEGAILKSEPFSHGNTVEPEGYPALVASYHPSPQNTYTGKLTEAMFLAVLDSLKKQYG